MPIGIPVVAVQHLRFEKPKVTILASVRRGAERDEAALEMETPMMRPTMSIAVLLASIALTTTVAAKTSISNLAQPELPCPATQQTEGSSAAALEPSLVVSPVLIPTTTPVKPSTRAARSRWKALLPGSIKSSG